jgi:hypothetical protein
MDLDYDDDDFVLPPRLDDTFLASTRSTHHPAALDNPTEGRLTSPIQIDEEVVVKQKRKPQIKLLDRYISSLHL